MSLELTCAKHRIALEKKHFPNGVTPREINLLDDVEQLLQRAYQAGAQSSNDVQAWSNQSAFGYAIMAAERVGFSESDTQRLIRALHNRFDVVSLEKAAEHYRRSSY
ncbi:hypothetical protein [Paenibacillus woosongensis]|uniref:Uncharacterized protein n=1 Tax=Paenibacillus woosongensis TaxID=307580 RepID=A0A7X2YXT5_9BACL|nr:hypothetical protein [Paenibacillus woosongensis]MUG43448.1 hypothetical protein [Paenibacillus woosongensis]